MAGIQGIREREIGIIGMNEMRRDMLRYKKHSRYERQSSAGFSFFQSIHTFTARSDLKMVS
jgi:hypothetical protein